jgi:hypothetical protein
MDRFTAGWLDSPEPPQRSQNKGEEPAMRSWSTIGKRETRDVANRSAPVSLALLTLVTAWVTAGCATTPTEPSVNDCVAMTEEELQQPIHIERFHIFDHTGIYRHRIRVSIEVGLDEQGYVTYPRVTESNVSKGINEEIVSAVSQWRWCPQFSQRLEGGRFEIPFDIPVRNLGGPDI